MARRYKISYKKLGLLVSTLGLSFAAAFWGQPLLHGNGLALGILVSVYSIFASALLAAAVTAGDPRRLAGENWRSAQASKPRVEAQVMHYFRLAALYLLSLVLFFFAALFNGHPPLDKTFEQFGLLFSTFAMVYTFGLIPQLKAMIDEDLTDEVRARMIQDGGNPKLVDIKSNRRNSA